MIPPDANEAVIEEFLEGQPRAASWRELREALEARRRDILAQMKELPADASPRRREELDARLATLNEQVSALATEEAVAQFVEDSVRSSLARPVGIDIGDEFDDDAGY